jgi:hypothetical protein
MTQCRHPLVVLERGAAGWAALRVGIEAADESLGRLSIVYPSVARFPWWTGIYTMGYVTLPNLGCELELLAAARDEVPAAIPLTTQILQGRGSAESQVLRAANGFQCDVIIVGESSWMGSRCGLAAALVRRSDLPVRVVELPPLDPGRVSAYANGRLDPVGATERVD